MELLTSRRFIASTAQHGRWLHPRLKPTAVMREARLSGRKWALVASPCRAQPAVRSNVRPVPHQGRTAHLFRWILWSTCLGFSLLLTAGCSTFRKQTIENQLAADQLAVRGQEAKRCGQSAQAIRLLQGAVAKKPNDITTRLQLVEALAQCGQADAAIRHLQSAIERSEPQPHLLIRLAELHADQGERALASKYLDQALLADPQSVAAWRLKGDLAFGQGELSMALAHYQQALKGDSQADDVWLRVAEVYRRTNRGQRALSTLEHMIQRYPVGSAPVAWSLLQGELLAELGQTERAIELLTGVTERDDAPASGYLLLGNVLLNNQRFAEAQSTLTRASERFPDDWRIAQALGHVRSAATGNPGIAQRWE